MHHFTSLPFYHSKPRSDFAAKKLLLLTLEVLGGGGGGQIDPLVFFGFKYLPLEQLSKALVQLPLVDASFDPN